MRISSPNNSTDRKYGMLFERSTTSPTEDFNMHTMSILYKYFYTASTDDSLYMYNVGTRTLVVIVMTTIPNDLKHTPKHESLKRSAGVHSQTHIKYIAARSSAI